MKLDAAAGLVFGSHRARVLLRLDTLRIMPA